MTDTLSLPMEAMRDEYDVVVVGSGYGGGIAASRLSRAGRRVCLLERGVERQPGAYPNSAASLIENIQVDTPAGHIGSETALFDMRYNDSINVVVGCGLGGTSLINAGICLRPDPHVFASGHWPSALQDEHALGLYYDRVQDMLRPTPTPPSFLGTAKTQALEKAASELATAAKPVPILVNFEALPGGTNHVGVAQTPCVGCGDCVSGCNYAAKSTLIMNYLPDARNFGAEIVTQTCVKWVEKTGTSWRVHGRGVGADGIARDFAVNAGIVVLAAGTLGSTEILLRSAQNGLSLSAEVGKKFSANGDMIGFAYDTDRIIDGVGIGDRDLADIAPVGPCSTVMVDWRAGVDVGAGMVVEDGAIPGALSVFLAPGLAGAAAVLGSRPDQGFWDALRRRAQEVGGVLDGAHASAVARTLFLLVMACDDSAGRMFLHDDRLRVDWPGLGVQPQFARASGRLAEIATALGGTYVQDPLWSALTHHSIISGHPLGGCAMADDSDSGVVNHKGQVFTGAAQVSDVHDGLYVMDGSVVPTALGVNPLFTISALAERSCAALAQDRGWTIDYTLPSARPGP